LQKQVSREPTFGWEIAFGQSGVRKSHFRVVTSECRGAWRVPKELAVSGDTIRYDKPVFLGSVKRVLRQFNR